MSNDYMILKKEHSNQWNHLLLIESSVYNVNATVTNVSDTTVEQIHSGVTKGHVLWLFA